MLVALSGNDYVHETRRQLTGLMTAIYTTQISETLMSTKISKCGVIVKKVDLIRN